jgi:cytochrome d ubiquinol oxidase subunit I
MEFLADPVLLARIQFVFTVCTHFLMVPISIGLGLILAIHETKYYKSGAAEDLAAANLWLKIFTTTFVLGVATGITMEFSFGTNWAYYSRFVGDIFGAPLAAEALFAFFLESTFLGVLLFGRARVSGKFYVVSAWLVWAGSCLSALWIIIANSWMQTPAGSELAADGSRAVIGDFAAAAFNPSTLTRYTHTVDSLLIMGAFFALAVAAYYLLKGKHLDFAMKNIRIGSVVGIITTCLMLVFAHSAAVGIANEQPTKFAMMEGAYATEAMPLYAFGIVDEVNQKVITPLAIPGGTSFLASNDFSTVYPGMNELAASEEYGDFDPSEVPVQVVFQSYHLMVAMYGVLALLLVLVLIFTFVKKEAIKGMRWLQKLLIISPLFPMLAIQAGWFTAEFGRQPWVVYPSTTGPDGVSLLTSNAASALTAPELIITIVLFVAIYAILFIAWGRICVKFIKQGPTLPHDAEDLAPKGGEAR